MKTENTPHEDAILRLAREIFPESLTGPIDGQRTVLAFAHRLLEEVIKREAPAAWLVRNNGRGISAYAWTQPFIGEGWENTPLYDLAAFTAVAQPAVRPNPTPTASRIIPISTSPRTDDRRSRLLA